MPNTVVWLHEEDLSPESPALCAADGAPAVFVIDTGWLRDDAISLKRVVFMYEAALETPARIVKGDPTQEVSAFAAEHGAGRVLAARTADPRITRQGEALGVDWVEPPPFVLAPPSGFDLKRFSRYWRRAEKQAMRPTRA